MGDGQAVDRGASLVEMLVVMLLFTGIIGVTTTILLSVHRSTAQSLARADDVAQARLGLAAIDRQVRSGNILYDPAAEALPLSMRIYTQADGHSRCTQWQVHHGVLRTRSWSPTWQADGGVEAWRTVARRVVNDAAAPPFYRPASTAFGLRLVTVDLRVETAGERVTALTSSLSGRNTIYGYDPGLCATVPPAEETS